MWSVPNILSPFSLFFIALWEILCLLRLHQRFQVDQRRFDITKEPGGFAIDWFEQDARGAQRFIPSQPENEGAISGVRVYGRWRCVGHAASITNKRSETVAKLRRFRKAL